MESCVACDLTGGRAVLPGGVIARESGWVLDTSRLSSSWLPKPVSEIGKDSPEPSSSRGLPEVPQCVDRQMLDEVVQPLRLAQALRQMALGDDRIHVRDRRGDDDVESV